MHDAIALLRDAIQVADLERVAAALRADRVRLDAAARRGTDDAIAAARLAQDKGTLEALVADLNRQARAAGWARESRPTRFRIPGRRVAPGGPTRQGLGEKWGERRRNA